MSDTQDLARRGVACKHWRWTRGMATEVGDIVTSDGFRLWWHHRGGASEVAVGTALPDLSDPATLGCLLALVREAWGLPTAHVEPSHADAALQWVAWVGDALAGDDTRFYGATEAEALVAALEAAP